MSSATLRVFSPDETQPIRPIAPSENGKASAENVDILPFATSRKATIFSGRLIPALERARILHHNSECPDCGRPNIQPLELNDALISPRSRLPVPGTATLIGFHCEDCGCEWPVFQISRRSV
jgi:5-methylcytosine-specific restriction endonuclease McrA